MYARQLEPTALTVADPEAAITFWSGVDDVMQAQLDYGNAAANDLLGGGGLPSTRVQNPAWVSRELRARLCPDATRVPGRHIYLTRGAARNNRAVLNEDKVRAVLETRGFTCLDPGSMTVRDQIRWFSEADLIVAPQSDADGDIYRPADVTEDLLMEAGRPVLVFGKWRGEAGTPASGKLVRSEIATMAPPTPPIIENPTASARLTWLLTSPSTPSWACDMAVTVVGLNNNPMPKPPTPQVMNVAHSGHPAASTGTLAANPRAIVAKPHRTARRGSISGWRDMNHCPQVQVSDAPMMTKPCMVGDEPWMRSAASGMKLSAPRNAAVAMIRHSTTAGRPRRARCTPSGNNRRRLGRPITNPAAAPPTAAIWCLNCRDVTKIPMPAAARIAAPIREWRITLTPDDV